MKKIIFWLMETKPYKWLLKKIIPYIRFTTYYTSLRGKKYHDGYRFLKRGHIILTIDKNKLTTVLIPGEFSHAGFCVGIYPNSYEIAEMTHSDYTKSFFFDLCKESDRVVLLECVDFDEAYVDKMISKCKSFENSKYDTSFKLGVSALYCSELIYLSDFEKRLKIDLTDLAGLGRPYISPTGLYLAENVKVIWDSDKVD